MHSSVEFNNFCVCNSGSRGVSSENLFFCFNNSLLFCRSACCEEGSIECHNLCLNLSFSFFGSHSGNALVCLTTNNDGSGSGSILGSRICKSLLLNGDLSLLFTFDLSIDLGLGKSGLQIFLLFGGLSSIHSHLESQNVGLNSCHLCGTLVGLLLQFCSFFLSLLLFLEFKLHLLAANSGFSKCLAFIRVQNLLGCGNSVICEYRSNSRGVGVAINEELIFVFLSDFRLNVDIDICRRFLVTVHQHVLDTADDVGGVVDKVCNNLYGGKFFRRHGDHIHLALGGDGQKANGNNTYACSANTAKVFLSALVCNFRGQIQATGCNTHGELGNRNNHQTARGNDLITNNGVRINNGAHLFQRIPDYFLDRRFVFHNE